VAGNIDAESAHVRPLTPALLSVLDSVSQRLEGLVREFISGPPPRATRAKVTTRQAASAHLLWTLEQCQGPISNQLSEFAGWLAGVSPASQHNQLSNNVLFWLEAAKFKVLYNTCIIMLVWCGCLGYGKCWN